ARIGRAHHLAVLGDGVLAFQHLHDDRTGGHEIDELAEERPLLVHAVETLRLFLGDADALLADDAQARLLDHRVDRAGQVALGGVWFEDRKSALERHRGHPFSEIDRSVDRNLLAWPIGGGLYREVRGAAR